MTSTTNVDKPNAESSKEEWKMVLNSIVGLLIDFQRDLEKTNYGIAVPKALLAAVQSVPSEVPSLAVSLAPILSTLRAAAPATPLPAVSANGNGNTVNPNPPQPSPPNPFQPSPHPAVSTGGGQPPTEPATQGNGDTAGRRRAKLVGVVPDTGAIQLQQQGPQTRMRAPSEENILADAPRDRATPTHAQGQGRGQDQVNASRPRANGATACAATPVASSPASPAFLGASLTQTRENQVSPSPTVSTAAIRAYSSPGQRSITVGDRTGRSPTASPRYRQTVDHRRPTTHSHHERNRDRELGCNRRGTDLDASPQPSTRPHFGVTRPPQSQHRAHHSPSATASASQPTSSIPSVHTSTPLTANAPIGQPLGTQQRLPTATSVTLAQTEHGNLHGGSDNKYATIRVNDSVGGPSTSSASSASTLPSASASAPTFAITAAAATANGLLPMPLLIQPSGSPNAQTAAPGHAPPSALSTTTAATATSTVARRTPPPSAMRRSATATPGKDVAKKSVHFDASQNVSIDLSAEDDIRENAPKHSAKATAPTPPTASVRGREAGSRAAQNLVLGIHTAADQNATMAAATTAAEIKGSMARPTASPQNGTAAGEIKAPTDERETATGTAHGPSQATSTQARDTAQQAGNPASRSDGKLPPPPTLSECRPTVVSETNATTHALQAASPVDEKVVGARTAQILAPPPVAVVPPVADHKQPQTATPTASTAATDRRVEQEQKQPFGTPRDPRSARIRTRPTPQERPTSTTAPSGPLDPARRASPVAEGKRANPERKHAKADRKHGDADQKHPKKRDAGDGDQKHSTKRDGGRSAARSGRKRRRDEVDESDSDDDKDDNNDENGGDKAGECPVGGVGGEAAEQALTEKLLKHAKKKRRAEVQQKKQAYTELIKNRRALEKSWINDGLDMNDPKAVERVARLEEKLIAIDIKEDAKDNGQRLIGALKQLKDVLNSDPLPCKVVCDLFWVHHAKSFHRRSHNHQLYDRLLLQNSHFRAADVKFAEIPQGRKRKRKAGHDKPSSSSTPSKPTATAGPNTASSNAPPEPRGAPSANHERSGQARTSGGTEAKPAKLATPSKQAATTQTLTTSTAQSDAQRVLSLIL